MLPLLLFASLSNGALDEFGLSEAPPWIPVREREASGQSPEFGECGKSLQTFSESMAIMIVDTKTHWVSEEWGHVTRATGILNPDTLGWVKFRIICWTKWGNTQNQREMLPYTDILHDAPVD